MCRGSLSALEPQMNMMDREDGRRHYPGLKRIYRSMKHLREWSLFESDKT